MTHGLSVRIEGLVCSVVNVVNGLPENWKWLVSRRRQSGADAVTIVLLSSPTFSSIIVDDWARLKLMLAELHRE